MPSERWLRTERVEMPIPEADPTEWLRKGFSKRTKAELVEGLIKLAKADRRFSRQIQLLFDIAAPADSPDLLVTTRKAIADATAFDKRRINHNFHYDIQAYEFVQRNFQQMVCAEQFDAVMELSLELMAKGSYQVENSDEGLMTEDIQDCLNVVIDGLEKSGLSPTAIVEWCDAMMKNDRVGFIAESKLKGLRTKFS